MKTQKQNGQAGPKSPDLNTLRREAHRAAMRYCALHYRELIHPNFDLPFEFRIRNAAIWLRDAVNYRNKSTMEAA